MRACFVIVNYTFLTFIDASLSGFDGGRMVNVCFFVGVTGIVAWYISRQIIQTNKEREAEQTQLNKRIADLQLSALQAQMNPHFIFNALGSIQYFIQTYNTVKADEFLTNFAFLMRSILESSKKKYISIGEELNLLQLYIGLEKVRFENLFEYEIKMDESIDLDDKIPPMIVQPFIENAINHGLYHLKDRKGLLFLSFEISDQNVVKIIIQDNGIGRKAASKMRTKTHKSRGLEIVENRIDTINSIGEMHVHVETHDLFQEQKPIGTQVVILVSDPQGKGNRYSEDPKKFQNSFATDNDSTF